MALPLLPPDRIANGFQSIKTYCREQGLMADVDIFMAYLEQTWNLDMKMKETNSMLKFTKKLKLQPLPLDAYI